MNEFKLVLSTGEFLSLLSQLPDGIHINEWNPKIAQRKGGGTFQDSPISPGRRLVYEQFADVQEEINFAVVGLDENDALTQLTELLRDYTEQIVSYWVNDWETTFCYLQITTKNGNTFYAILKSYTLPEIGNPFAQPMFTKLVTPNMPKLSTTLERSGLWSKLPPGSGEILGTLVQGVSEDTSFISNYFSDVDLSHIYVDDGGVFGANQVASTAFDLLPTVPAVNDAIYFGNDDGYPFFNIVLDLSQGLVGTGITVQVEFWNGASWAGASLITSSNYDGTNVLQDTGANIIAFRPTLTGSGWTTTTVNGVNALWMRLRISALITVSSNPVQQNRIIYHQNKPYINISEDDISGDDDCLLKLKMERGVPLISTSKNYFLGRRIVPRGENFTAYINLSDRQVISGISITFDAFGGCSLATYNYASNGRVILYDQSTDAFPTGSLLRRFFITLSQSLAREYAGTYRVFLVGQGLVASVINYDVQIKVVNNADDTIVFYESLPIQVSAGDGTSMLAGLLEFDQSLKIPLNSPSIDIEFYLETDGGTDDYRFITLVLIPVDEFSCLADIPSQTGGMSNDEYIEFSSLDPKDIISAITKLKSTDETTSIAIVLCNRLITLKEKENQRLWSMVYKKISSSGSMAIAETSKISSEKNERYISLRGNQ